VSEGVARFRELVARGYAVAAGRACCRSPARLPDPNAQAAGGLADRPAADEVEASIVALAQEHPTDGDRLITVWARRKLGRAINRKRTLRVMRERKLIQRSTPPPRRRCPGFKVERPGQLWHMDMTSVWVAEHGWVYLNAIIDCCTRGRSSAGNWRCAAAPLKRSP
jgi:transposase InsO family protein